MEECIIHIYLFSVHIYTEREGEKKEGKIEGDGERREKFEISVKTAGQSSSSERKHFPFLKVVC